MQVLQLLGEWASTERQIFALCLFATRNSSALKSRRWGVPLHSMVTPFSAASAISSSQRAASAPGRPGTGPSGDPDPALGVQEGAADALGLAGLVQLEALVHGADHHVELVEDGVGPVERAVLQDVHLAAAQDADLGHLLLHLRDLVPLALEAVDVEPLA